jgi:hypothetical protein
MKLSDIHINPKNPRLIKDDRFYKLVKSIQEFPKMMELRPIITDSEGMILGGNMRFKALKELKYKEVPDQWVKRADELTDEEKQRFIIVDNIEMGEHDWEKLKSDWDKEQLIEWGLEFDDKVDKLKDGELIEFERSVQIEPPKEYIVILAEPNSVEWEDIKDRLKLKMVRRGGYKKGSPFDDIGLERVLKWEDFKERMNVNSSAK